MSIVERILLQYDRAIFTVKDKVFFLREVAYLIEWWVSITDAIGIIQESAQKTSIMMICRSMLKGLHQWDTLSTVMRTLPEYFNEGDANIVNSWEASWELTNVLQYLAQEYEYLHAIKNKYTSALTYPLFLLIISLGAIYLLFTEVLPWIFIMVEQFAVADIPTVTQWLIYITNFLSNYWWRMVVGLILVMAIIGLIVSTNQWKRWLYTSSFDLPIIGKVIQYYTLIKCLRYMKLLLYSGMHYTQVFKYLLTIMSNTAYTKPIEDVIEALQSWEGIAQTFQRYPNIVPKDVVTLLKVGEETASLPRSLDNAILIYEWEFQRIVEWLSKILEPLLIVFVWGIIAITALSVFGIIGTMLDSIQGWF
jgi:type IV pilus assembly protein PilC